jgi:signal peptidase I
MERRFVLRGSSMRPFFKPGDVLMIEPVSPEAVKRLQIIAFRRDGAEDPTVHRVIDIVRNAQGLSFTTKGDSVDSIDPSIGPGELEGKLVGKVVEGRVKRVTQAMDVGTYYGSRFYWAVRRMLRRPFYKLLDRAFPLLPLNFVLLTSSSGFIIKAMIFKKVVAQRAVGRGGERFWCAPLLSSSRRRELEERLARVEKNWEGVKRLEGSG